MANFNVDSSGNVWIGTGVSNTFSTAQGQANTKFYVTSAGSIFATSGTIGGISINSGDIQANYTQGSAGFKITSSTGDAEFNNVIVRGTLNGVTVDQPVDIDFSSGGKIRTSSSGARVEIKETNNFPAIDFYGNKTTSLYDNQAGQFSIISNGEIELSGTDGIHLGATVINLGDKTGTLATRIAISGDHGGSTDVIKSNGNNAYWGTLTGGGVNAIQAVGELSVNSNTGSVVINSNHSHSGIANENYVNSRGFGTGNGNSNLSVGNGSNNAAPGSHPNSGHHSHAGTVLTTAGADNLYASAHNHPYSSSNHGNSAHNVDFAAESYVNGQITSHRFSVSHSDERLKEDVAPITLGLDFLNRLTPRDFNWKSSHLDTLYSSDDSMDLKYKGMTSNLQQGFVAQEVKQAVFDETGSNTAFSGLKIGDITDYDSSITSDADDMGRIELENFIPPLVKAVQQLSAKIEVLEARVDELEGT